MLLVQPPVIPTQICGKLRKGCVVSFLGKEAEVTDFGVCLQQCDQQTANLRLECKSPDLWVCPPPPFGMQEH